jgi:hypothetical protein
MHMILVQLIMYPADQQKGEFLHRTAILCRTFDSLKSYYISWTVISYLCCLISNNETEKQTQKSKMLKESLNSSIEHFSYVEHLMVLSDIRSAGLSSVTCAVS